MSYASDIYNEILTELGALFPTKTRIPNPYSLAENNDQFLVNGYGLKVGGAELEPFEFSNFVVGREFTIVFTKEVIRVNSSYAEYDTISLSLLESVYDVQKLFFNYNELGIEASIQKVDIVGSSSIEAVSDKNNFYFIECTFNFSIKESF